MAGHIQNQDLKSEADLIAGGATKSSLPNDDKAYVGAFALDKTMREAIKAFDLGTGDTPLRMYPNQTAADSKLYFKGNARQVIDGTTKITAPINGSIGSFVDSSIDWQTGTITGGTFLHDGFAFSFPSTTVGEHRRFAFSLQSDGSIAVNYSSAVASVASLPNAGVLFATLLGTGIGYIDLEATASTAYKTSGSSTSVIEAKVGGDSRIWWFGGGAGGGSSSSIPFTLSNNVSTPADVTGFLVNPANNRAFKASYSIERAYGSIDDAVGSRATPFYSNIPGGITGGYGYGSKVHPSGRIIVYGSFTGYGVLSRDYIVMINPDGTEYSSFYTNTNGGAGGFVQDVAVQPDGKIIVVGDFTTFGGVTRSRVVRLNQDGTEDYTYYANTNGGAAGAIYSVSLQDDGKAVLCGDFTTFGGVTRNRIVRLNQDGTEDSTFYTNTSGGFTGGYVWTVRVQPDGKILCGGTFTTLGGSSRALCARLLSTGAADTAFHTALGSMTGTYVRAFEILPDESIIIGGGFTTVNGNTRNNLIKTSSAGVEDSTFYTSLGAGGVSGHVFAIKIHQFGTLLLGGSFTSIGGVSRVYTARIYFDGTADSYYYGNVVALGDFSDGTPYHFEVLPDGDIIITGDFTTLGDVSRSSIDRLNGDSFIQNTRNGTLYGSYSSSDKKWTLTEGMYTGLESPGAALTMTPSGQLQYTTTDLSSYGSVISDTFKYSLLGL